MPDSGSIETVEAPLCNATQTLDCARLAGVWRDGEAVCRADRSGFDVTRCLRREPSIPTEITFTESVKPAEREPRWENALANNGQPFPMEIALARIDHQVKS